MLFNSFEFVIFFAAILLIYPLLGLRKQNILLLVASYFFYGCWDWRFLSLIGFSTVVDYFCGRGIGATNSAVRKRHYLTISLVTNLGLLAIFKYYNFFAENLQDLFSIWGVSLDWITLNIVLPVGISFYTFQTLSYTIDVYRGRLQPEKDFLNFSLFVSFFPQLVAGPIERASELLPQLNRNRCVSAEDVRIGCWLIFWGYFLKVFVADNLALVVDQVFQNPQGGNGLEALLGVYAFAFQIFGDFAGYSSIAIGVARLLGFTLMTNFLFPYFVTSPQEFWKHWHISLSSWLRDYLYISLGGNRYGELRTYRNLFLTMLLGGIWHGAAWTFVLWGVYQGFVLIVHRLVSPFLAYVQFGTKPMNAVWFVTRVFVMFQITCIGWLIFRADSLSQVVSFLNAILFNVGGISDRAVYYMKYLGCYSLLMLMIQVYNWSHRNQYAILQAPAIVKIATFVLMFYCMAVWGEYGTQQFIYFQF